MSMADLGWRVYNVKHLTSSCLRNICFFFFNFDLEGGCSPAAPSPSPQDVRCLYIILAYITLVLQIILKFIFNKTAVVGSVVPKLWRYCSLSKCRIPLTQRHNDWSQKIWMQSRICISNYSNACIYEDVMYVKIKYTQSSYSRNTWISFHQELNNSPDFLSLPVEADRSLEPGLGDSHERLLSRIPSSFLPSLWSLGDAGGFRVSTLPVSIFLTFNLNSCKGYELV